MTPSDGTGLRERNKRRVRRAILDEASARITESGYAAMTMRDVAERAGVSYQTLYNYFPNKAALALALLSDQTEAANVQANALRAAGTDEPLATTLRVADLYVALTVSRERALWQDVVAELIRQGHWHYATTATFDTDIRASIAAFYAACQEAGTLGATADPRVLADVIYAVGDHAMLRFIADAQLSVSGLRALLYEQLRCVLEPQLVTG